MYFYNFGKFFLQKQMIIRNCKHYLIRKLPPDINNNNNNTIDHLVHNRYISVAVFD